MTEYRENIHTLVYQRCQLGCNDGWVRRLLYAVNDFDIGHLTKRFAHLCMNVLQLRAFLFL
jgi:hypothetical protein